MQCKKFLFQLFRLAIGSDTGKSTGHNETIVRTYVFSQNINLVLDGGIDAYILSMLYT